MTSEGGMSPADYAAINGNNNGFGYGGFSEWIIVLFLFAMFGFFFFFLLIFRLC